MASIKANKKDGNTICDGKRMQVEELALKIRNYIPILARRNRCFARSIETLYAVVDVFVEAYRV